MAAPNSITACINDINAKKLVGKNIPSMGDRGGAGCRITNASGGIIEIEYLANNKRFKVTQKEYTTFEKRLPEPQKLDHFM